jgi:hypothetical protein
MHDPFPKEVPIRPQRHGETVTLLIPEDNTACVEHECHEMHLQALEELCENHKTKSEYENVKLESTR